MSGEMLAANLAAHWIQAGVLSIVTLSTIHLLRVKEPRMKLAVLHLVLVLIVLLPWMQRWRIAEASVPAPSQELTAAVAVTMDATAPMATPAPPMQVRRSIQPAMIALGVIVAGIALRLAWLFLGFIRLRRFAQETRSIEPTELAEDVQARVGAVAQYLEHPTAGTPSTFGVFKPRVVLPARFVTLTAAHQEGALCHELIHVKRRDVAAALAEEILMAVLWFHPWIWMIRSRVRVAREQLVDQQVLELTGDRAEYVRCLIEMSGHDLLPHLSQAGAAMVRSNELRARVDAIFQEVRMSRLRIVMVSAALAVVVGVTAWAAAAQAPLYAMAPQTTSPVYTLSPVERAAAAVSSVQQAIGRRSVLPNASSFSYEVDGRVLRVAPQGTLAAGAPAQASQQASAPDQMRRLLKVAYAEYPPDAMEKQISGVVKVSVTVNSVGEVTTADVTSGPMELRASAFKAAMGLKYSPGVGTVKIDLGLEYRLDPQSWGVRVIQDAGFIPPPPPRSPASALPPGTYRVGGEISAPKKIKDQAPVYPAVAQNARVQGVVILEATVSETGSVVNTRIIRSVPLLDQAASDAVMQWQYTPTLLNGVAVPIVMTVTVNFTVRDNLSLNIGLPTGGTANLRVNGGVSALDLPNVGKFGFMVSEGQTPGSRSIAIYKVGDATAPAQLLGNVQVEINGGAVQSPTTPSFGVELVRNP